jgi:hypothetical protein
MPENNHSPWIDRNFSVGVNTQLESSLEGRQSEGEFLASRNMRSNSMDGDLGVSKAIKGEEVEFAGVDNSWNSFYQGNFITGHWMCNTSCSVIIDSVPVLVELWCDELGIKVPFIRVNGVIVAASSQLPIYYDKPIQLTKKDSKEAPEISFTNNIDLPVVLGVDDILLNSGISVNGITGLQSEKYFSDFDINLYGIQVNIYNHMPRFVEITTDTTLYDISFLPPTGNPGLKVGQHCYRMRYTSATGDKSSLTIPTPLIPMVKNDQKSVSDCYPNAKEYGAIESTQSVNSGIVLKFRVENRLNYEYIEIYRTSYDTGQPLGFTPSSVLVGFVPITNGEMSVKTIADFGGDEGALTEEEESDVPRSIKTCKSIRYFGNKKLLFNVEYGTNVVDNTVFGKAGGNYPVLKLMGASGHADPYNATYFKSDMGGERYSYAYIFFDSNFARSFALPVPGLEDYMMPNRRDRMTAQSEQFSYDWVPKGCDTDNVTEKSIFERFSLRNAKQKTSTGIYTIHDSAYNPLTPKGQEDTDNLGLDQTINTEVDLTENEKDRMNYNPKGFAPEYYSLGMALPGVDTSKLPGWVTGFTVVRTEAAGRVKFQGLGFYDISGSTKKELDQVAFYSPDTDSLSGLIDPTTLDYDNLKAEVVAPYGFFSELYNGRSSNVLPLWGSNDFWVDMAIYARVIRDTGDINVYGQANGVNGNAMFGRWRNPTVMTWADQKFDIDNYQQYSGSNVQLRADGNMSEFFTLKLKDNIYEKEEVLNGERHYLDNGVKEFHEPLYLFNIINDQAHIPDQNIVNFFDTGVHVKIKSCIGKFDMTTNVFPLVDERWEDCIPALYTTAPQFTNLKGRDTFIYIKNLNGESFAWLNVTYKNETEIDALRLQIHNYSFATVNGVNVYGLYTHTDTNEHRDFSIVFDVLDFDGVLMQPDNQDEVWVHYDNSLPVSVFGGDTWVGETIFCPVDREKNNENSGGCLPFSIGLPYVGAIMHPDYGLIGNAGTSHGTVYGAELGQDSIRQLVVLYCCESKVQLNYQYEIPTKSRAEIGASEYPSYNKYFPATHYIMRPNLWKDTLSDNYANNGSISQDYRDNYPNEDMLWGWGGFRYRPLHDMDYYHNQRWNIYPSKPTVGYKERIRYYDRVVYSLAQIPGTQSAPSLRTFLAGNFYDVEDIYGEGKFLWSGNSDRGDNIYCVTETGIALVLVGKNILSQSDGVELATMIGTQGQYIGGHIWIENNIGSTGEMWRGIAERDSNLFFPNKDSVYVLSNNKTIDIGRQSYHNTIYPLLSAFPLDSSKHMTGVFNNLHGEYWLQIETDSDEYVMAYAIQTKHWNDRYDHRYCKYVAIDNDVYGVGNKGLGGKTNISFLARTDKLGVGTIIGGQEMSCELTDVVAPFKSYPEKAVPFINAKEFIRIKINSNVKPKAVYFYDYLGQEVQAELSEEESGEYYLKDYTNFEQYIPRRKATADVTRKRMQGRQLVYKIYHDEGDFILRQVSIQFKELL